MAIEGSGSGTNEPIKFSAIREERRAERQRRRAEKANNSELSQKLEPGLNEPFDDFRDNDAIAVDRSAKPESEAFQAKKKKWFFSWAAISFLLIVLIPGAISSGYFWIIASPQYQVETQFSVRGSSQSSMATLGLGSLLGNSVQSSDSYIVASYIESLQLIRDVKQELNIDLRQFYTRDGIDLVYKIKPDMPIEQFAQYWRSMNNVSFNATTGNITLYIYAFSAEDSKTIADAVLKVSEKLVNTLSENSRKQLTDVAYKQVERSEGKLRAVRDDIRKLRIDEKAFDPTQIAAMENSLTSGIESQLSNLRSKLSALLQSVSVDAPSAVVMQRQIDALEEQLALQKAKLGTPDSVAGKGNSDGDSNLAEVMTKFEKLTVEQGFATQAYTTSLAALETALAEAQKQERYFATFVEPIKPEIALYPMRMLDSFIAVLILLAIWSINQFLYRSFRDHTI